jgi:hypothetical protein
MARMNRQVWANAMADLISHCDNVKHISSTGCSAKVCGPGEAPSRSPIVAIVAAGFEVQARLKNNPRG